MNWYHQYVPGDMWDYDAAGTHILDGSVSGQPHKLVTHSARNGFLYALERTNGQTLLAKPYIDEINWTKGIDQKTGLPIDYDPTKDIQVYSGLQNQTLTDRTKKLCPSHEGGNNYWSASFSQRTRLLYIPSRPTCNEMTMTPDQLRNPTTGSMLGGGIRLLARTESEIVVADPFTGEVTGSGPRHSRIHPGGYRRPTTPPVSAPSRRRRRSQEIATSSHGRGACPDATVVERAPCFEIKLSCLSDGLQSPSNER
jgi:glucose dehydrogenase